MSLFWGWLKCHCVYCLANIFLFSVHLRSSLCKAYFSGMLSWLGTVIVNNCNLRKRIGCGVMIRTRLILVQQCGWSFVGPQLLCSFTVITHFTQAAQTIEHSRNAFGGWKVSGSHRALLKVTTECLAKLPFLTPCTLFIFFLLKQSLLALREFFSWLLPYFPTHDPLFKLNLYKMNLLLRLGSWRV